MEAGRGVLIMTLVVLMLDCRRTADSMNGPTGVARPSGYIETGSQVQGKLPMV